MGQGEMNRTARAQSLELGGWEIAEGLVQAGGVETADVFDDRQLELGAGAPDTVGDELGLEAVDEALGHCAAATPSGCAGHGD